MLKKGAVGGPGKSSVTDPYIQVPPYLVAVDFILSVLSVGQILKNGFFNVLYLYNRFRILYI